MKYVLYIRYVSSSYFSCLIRSTSCDLGYYSSSHSSIGSILDRASINQLAASNSSPSSRNIVLKASVTLNVDYSSLYKYNPEEETFSNTEDTRIKYYAA